MGMSEKDKGKETKQKVNNLELAPLSLLRPLRCTLAMESCAAHVKRHMICTNVGTQYILKKFVPLNTVVPNFSNKSSCTKNSKDIRPLLINY